MKIKNRQVKTVIFFGIVGVIFILIATVMLYTSSQNNAINSKASKNRLRPIKGKVIEGDVSSFKNKKGNSDSQDGGGADFSFGKNIAPGSAGGAQVQVGGQTSGGLGGLAPQ